jgi:hypothetical protein
MTRPKTNRRPFLSQREAFAGSGAGQAGELTESMRLSLAEPAHLPSAQQIAAEMNRRGIKSGRDEKGPQWNSR